MTDEVVLAEAPAPEQVATAAPEAEVSTPDVETQQQEPQKVFTQEELDAAIGKRLAREQRKWEREQAARMADLAARVPQAAVQDAMPSDQQDVIRLAEQIAQQREEARQKAAAEAAFREREEDVREKYADFEQVAYNPALPITPAMAETIYASDSGPELAYYLGSNPAEAARIARLSPFLQAKELGRIEAKIAAEPPKATRPPPPPPINPVAARSVGVQTYDTTDPRSTKTMNASEWIEAERLRQFRKLEAQRSIR